MKHLLFFILFVAAANAQAQCDQFDNLLKKGDNFLKGKKPNYQEAINAYTAAILACSDRAGEAQKRIAKMVNDINQLRENADTEKKRAEAALKKAEKLINAFYFYGGRFALAFRHFQFVEINERDSIYDVRPKFYFIANNGDPVEKLGKYDKAEEFDIQTGLARVRNEGKDYLLDTFGTTHLAAYTITDLDSSIIALDLWGRQLDSFPDEIFHYPQLEVLILNGEYYKRNKLTLPPTIGQLTRLKSIHLANCQLDALPVEIGRLANLQRFHLSSNQLGNLPAEIGQLKNLQELDLHNNQLDNLPAEIGQMKNLQWLNLVGNPLIALPAEIGQLVNLQGLYLGGHSLAALPPQIEQLTNLQELYLSNSQLRNLPAEIGYMNSLQSLNLCYNQLSSLPAEVGQLQNLQSLDLAYNQLNSLPAEIRNLKSLKWLNLEGNPFPAEYISYCARICHGVR